MRIPNRAQVAVLGNIKVKHRRGWSSRKRSSSQIAEVWGTTLLHSQIVNLSKHGKPVFPMTIRKPPRARIQTAPWKDIIESGVSVKPRSLKRVADVKMPLVAMSMIEATVFKNTYHHTLLIPSLSTMLPQGSVSRIQGTKLMIPIKCHPTKYAGFVLARSQSLRRSLKSF